MAELEKWIDWYPAWDKRNTDPAKNYGVHGVEIVWYVKGPKGGVSFSIYTNWMLPHLRKKWDEYEKVMFMEAKGMDLSYHAKVPQYEDQTSIQGCKLTDGPCYYDGSTLNAGPVFELLVAKGGEAVWEYLVDYYHQRFDATEEPSNA